MNKCFIKSTLLVVTLFLTASCSLFREKTVQDIIDQLPRYDDNTPVRWNTLAPSNLQSIKTIGDLKQAIKNGLDPNKPLKYGDTPSDYLCKVLMGMNDNKEELRSRLAALDVLLAAGANPQRMNGLMLVTEEEYALYIKHGLSAKAPIEAREGGAEYPLTNRQTLLSPPIVKWLLENGADPNQLELHKFAGVPKISPLSNAILPPKELLFPPYPYCFANYVAVLRKHKTPKYKRTIIKMLKEHGATVCPPYPIRYQHMNF